MYWGAISSFRKITLLRLEGYVNSEKYREVLWNHLLPHMDETLRALTFQQDNTSLHTSSLVRSFYQERITVIDWPAKSPDINPIKNLWALMKNKVTTRSPGNFLELELYV